MLHAFCSLLKRDVKESYKSKGNALVSVLAANVLMAAFQKDKSWQVSVEFVSDLKSVCAIFERKGLPLNMSAPKRVWGG